MGNSSLQSLATYSSLRSLSPPYTLFLSHLSSLLSLQNLPLGKQLHAHLLSLGSLHHPSLLPRLVSLYCFCGVHHDASSLLLASPSKDSLPWNILICGYVRCGSHYLSLSAYDSMVERRIDPDCFTYPSVLKACGELRDLGRGRKIHEGILAAIDDAKMEWNLFVFNSLVSMYGKCGEIAAARKVFDEMALRDAVSWNSVVSAYASVEGWGEAFGLFERMRVAEEKPNVVTWNTIAGGYLKLGMFMEALGLIREQKEKNAELDFVTAVVAINACARLGLVRLGKEAHGLAVRHGFHETDAVRNSLISMYLNCRCPSSAETIFVLQKENELVAWNCMVSGYAAQNLVEEASRLFREMTWRGVELRPNHVTILAILPMFGRLADLRCGKELHGYVAKQSLVRPVWNSLIDMYCKAGRVGDARKVFDVMGEDRDEVSYTSMIAGHGMEGDCRASLELFGEMRTCGRMKVDGVAVVSVLSACSHAGLVSEAEEVFEAMVSHHGIAPKLEHYSCMVDLYGRAGQLEKAARIIEGMPMEPTAVMWAALLAACQSWRNTEIGEKAANGLLKAETDNPGHYVLAANMYASAGCWEELSRVRMMMRDLGLKKTPGRAWLSLEDGVHTFVVEDRDTAYADEIYTCLAWLTDHMRDTMAMPTTDSYDRKSDHKIQDRD